MKITTTTTLWVMGKDGLSKSNLTGLMNMARGGTEPHEIVVYTDEDEARAADGIRKLRQQVARMLDHLDTDADLFAASRAIEAIGAGSKPATK